MIKICGLRREEDIAYVNLLKPEYIGFIFAPSKRQVTKEQAKELKDILDSHIKTVGVFVNENIKNILEIDDIIDLDVIQLHGDEDNKYIEELKTRLNTSKEIWKAIRVENKESLEEIKTFDVDAILLDTYSNEAYGGLGKTFDWNIVSSLKLDKKIILAGGIDETNIKTAKHTVKADIIDVSSGVENEGFKNYKKMKKLIERGRL